MQLVWLFFPYGGYDLVLMVVLYAILFWVVLPFSFGYIGGRFKRHAFGITFSLIPYIFWFIASRGIVVLFLYFMFTSIGYYMGFTRQKPSKDSKYPSKKREGAGDISTK